MIWTDVKVVAAWMVRLLMRSRLLVVYWGLAMAVVLFAVLANETGVVDEGGGLSGFPSDVPYLGVFLGLVLMVLPLSVLGCAWARWGRGTDSAEALLCRPVGNTGHVWGMAVAFWMVFGGAMVLLMLAVGLVNVVFGSIEGSAGAYLFYLVTLVLPGVVFATGLALSVGTVVRHGAVGGLLVLVFWEVVFGAGAEGTHGVLDPLGLTLPNEFSGMTGHPGMGMYLLQWACWLLVGLGLTALAVRGFERLPNRWGRGLVAGVVCLAAGLVAGGGFAGKLLVDEVARERFREVYGRYAGVEAADVLSRVVEHEQVGRVTRGRAVLRLCNGTGKEMERLVLYLNPGLRVTAVSEGNGQLAFGREEQVVTVERALAAGDTAEVCLVYEGQVDERVCYPDVAGARWSGSRESTRLVYRPGGHYAYAGEDFTLLTPEALWYPMTLPAVNPALPYGVGKDFAVSELRVKVRGRALSQGSRSTEGEWTLFRSERPLPGISLCAGDFEAHEMSVDGVRYEVNVWREHAGLWRQLEGFDRETVEEAIRGARGKMEMAAGNAYPHESLVLVESPVAFRSHFRGSDGGSDGGSGHVQPGMIFLPERGRGVGVSKRSLSASSLEKDFVWLLTKGSLWKSDFSWARVLGWDRFSRRFYVPGEERKNPWLATAMFGEQLSDVHSGDYPCLNAVVNRVMRVEKKQNIDMRLTMRAMEYLCSRSLKEALADGEVDAEMMDEVLRLKAEELANLVMVRGISREEMLAFFRDFRREHAWERVEAGEMSRAFGERFGWELEEVLPEWYTRDRVARCIVKFGPLFQVRNDDDTRRRARVEFAVWNEGEVEALVNVRCENRVFDGADVVEEQVVRVAPGSGKRVAMMFGELQSVELNTGISSNLPSIFSDRIQGSFTEDTVRGEWEVGKEYFLPDEGVYLTDNRDAGCRVKESARRWLESLTGGEGERYWNLKSPLMVPNERWWEYLSAGAEGMAIRSFLYRGAGTGGSSVEWETELPEDGRYEVFVFIPNDAPANFLLGEKGRIQEYTVCPRGEKEERMDVPLKWGDWTSLGVYDCEKGVSRVVLSDRGVKGQCITADAVKWVRVED